MRPVLPTLIRASVRSHPLRAAITGGVIEQAIGQALGQAGGWSESLRLFAHTWLGGLVFFGTFIA